MNDLEKKIANLPKRAADIVARLLSAIDITHGVTFDPKHWLMTSDLYQIFGLRLCLYHLITSTPLSKSAFEGLLLQSCKEAGIPVESAPSKTAEVDMVLNGKKTSLKSEERIHTSIHISKFCELGWGDWNNATDLYYKINMRSPQDTNRTYEKRITSYDKVMTLRNQVVGGKISYELLEIPIAVFARILEIPLSDYADGIKASKSKTIPKSFRVKIPWSKKKGSKDIVVLFDGGGERKLTITLPRESAGVEIASWKIESGI
jgi:hypothetical protein